MVFFELRAVPTTATTAENHAPLFDPPRIILFNLEVNVNPSLVTLRAALDAGLREWIPARQKLTMELGYWIEPGPHNPTQTRRLHRIQEDADVRYYLDHFSECVIVILDVPTIEVRRGALAERFEHILQNPLAALGLGGLDQLNGIGIRTLEELFLVLNLNNPDDPPPPPAIPGGAEQLLMLLSKCHLKGRNPHSEEVGHHDAVHQFLDHLNTHCRLEFVPMLEFSTLYEVLAPFTRELDVIRAHLNSLCDFDKTNFESVLNGIRTMVIDQWGVTVPVQIFLITDGSTGFSGFGPGSLKDTAQKQSRFHSLVIIPYGQQIKENLPWYPQELCNDWPHQASALSFGESSVLKYSLSYPRRTGLDSSEEDFPEFTLYYINPAGDQVEEFFVSRGVVVMSVGPIGGPSSLKAIYRPHTSYGTGVGVRSVVKAGFYRHVEGPGLDVDSGKQNLNQNLNPTANGSSNGHADSQNTVTGSNANSNAGNRSREKETYICLVEKSGISHYSEKTSEAYVTYLPEFNIERIIPCDLGLLVVPVRQLNSSQQQQQASSGDKNHISDDKFLYLLTDPIKQISKIWLKPNPLQDYIEYNGSSEVLLGCEKDLCVFWSLKNDKIILRRLVKFEPADILQCSALNASTYHFHTTQFSTPETLQHLHGTLGAVPPGASTLRPNTPHINLNLFSPFRRPSTSNGMRVNREGSNVLYWPTFDYHSFAHDSSINHGLAHGFFPPHVCVYDDPEAYLRTLFNIDIAKGYWIPPQKFAFASSADCSSSVALVCQMKKRIYLWGVDVNSGKKLSHFCIKNVESFSCSNGERDGISFMVLLMTSGDLKMCWFDSDFHVTCMGSIDYSGGKLGGPRKVLKVDNIFFGDTIVCSVGPILVSDSATTGEATASTSTSGSTKPRGEKLLIELKNYQKNRLIRKCMEGFKNELSSRIVVRIIGGYMESSVSTTEDKDQDEAMELTSTRESRNQNRFRKMNIESPPVEVEKEGKSASQYFDSEWEEFLQVVQDVIASEPANQRNGLGIKIMKVVDNLKETLKIYGSADNYFDKLEILIELIAKFTKEKSSKHHRTSSTNSPKSQSYFVKFAQLLLHPDPSSQDDFEDLPEIMQLLLDAPDAFENLKKIVEIKRKEALFAPAIEILIHDIFLRNQVKCRFDWPESVIKAVGRFDYLSGKCGLTNKSVLPASGAGGASFNVTEEQAFVAGKAGSGTSSRVDVEDTLIFNVEEISWMTHVLKMAIFSDDRRLEEVCRLLDSSSPLSIDVEQRAEMSDHEYVEEQEKNLLQLVQVAFSAPVGRAAFTLRTEEKNFANLTSHIYLPKLCISGRCATKGTSIDLNDSDLPTSYSAWPSFHNAVASALSVRFLDAPADAWFAYNKTKTGEGAEQAGMVLGFGLNGILSAMPPTLRHEYLAKENSFTTMSMLLGLSANLAGTGDISTWKLISLHISAMLPACTTELEIPRFATLVAPACLGLLFLGTHNSHVAKVLLGEISKRYSPLSVFGSNTANNSASNVNMSEMSVMAPDREAHTLCAGFGLGFVNLGKGRLNEGNMEDGFDGILRRFVVGGPKPTNPASEDEDVFNQYGQSLPSLWEEYRCCHIEEGDNVNVDVTTPSAIIAVALIYLRSGNEAVLKWLSPPSTLHLLDGVRPDLLMLRALASILVFDEVSDPNINWLEDHLMPESLTINALKLPEKNSRTDHESINQAWASIVCGYCLGLGIRFAGTSDSKVNNTLWHYTSMILTMSSQDSKLSEYFPKNFLECSACTLLISLALVSAGTGDVKVLRLARYLQAKVATTVITTSSNTYGFEMCISMATGILFLGGGRYSLSNDDKSIAVLLASVFPKWPINASDNRYHLQSLRHLYVLAAQPRLILPKPLKIPLNSFEANYNYNCPKTTFFIEFNDGQITEASEPVLLPPFYLMKRVRMESKQFLSIEFNLPEDLPHLKRIVEGGGILNLVEKPLSCQQYGFMKKMAWRQQHNFHSTFRIDEDTPAEERFIIDGFNLVSRLAEWNGIPQTIPAFLDLQNGDPSDSNWIWQVRILYWWVLKSQSEKKPTAIHKDLLASLLVKGSGSLNLFPQEHDD